LTLNSDFSAVFVASWISEVADQFGRMSALIEEEDMDWITSWF